MTGMDIRTIARLLGGEITGPRSCNVPAPGHSPKDRSLSIVIGRNGAIVVNPFANNTWQECRDYVHSRLGIEPWKPGSGRRPPLAIIDTGLDDKKNSTRTVALKIWEQGIDARGTVVERYLREHRGLSRVADSLVMRFHAHLYYDGARRLPGMVCLMRNIVTDEPTGIHRTFLDPKTAAKIDRKMLGIAKDAAIKLDDERGVTTALTIGEGVETVLSAREAGMTPAWALGSSGAVKHFPVLKRLTKLTLLRENDPTSEKDVATCAKRYLAAKRPVNMVTSHVGNDFNDAWRFGREVAQ